MGNFTSCCVPSSSSSTQVFGADGGLKTVHVPVTAAELMLEAPGHVVCSIESLVESRRIIPLKADHQPLMNGGVYMLVQATRVNCIVSELEIAIVRSACKRNILNKLRRKSCTKVVEDLKQTTTATTTSGHHQIRQCWIPVLEPIAEVC